MRALIGAIIDPRSSCCPTIFLMDRQKAKDKSKQNNFYHPFSPLEVEGIIEKEIRHENCPCHHGTPLVKN